jgi:hypothetical protein
VSTLERLASYRGQVDDNQKQLESPRAAYEMIDLFTDFFALAGSEFDRLLEEIVRGARLQHADDLRQLVLKSAALEARCRQFSDMWISKPLPYENMRPLLSGIHGAARDQLAEFRGLSTVADEIHAAAIESGQAITEGEVDRRQFWTRIVKPNRRDE